MPQFADRGLDIPKRLSPISGLNTLRNAVVYHDILSESRKLLCKRALSSPNVSFDTSEDDDDCAQHSEPT
jgi:hypothetical protein